MSSYTLRNILYRCHNLKRLEFPHGSPQLVNNVMREGLINSKHSVESLKMTISHECLPPPREEWQLPSLIGPIADFSALSIFDIDVHALDGTPRVPQSTTAMTNQ